MSNQLKFFMRNTRRRFLVVMLGFVFLDVFAVWLRASRNVGVSWNPSPDVDVVGYNVYYGTASGVYSFVLNLDNVASTQVYGLADGLTYYFAVSAIDSAGAESALSEEVSYTVPLPDPVALQTQMFNDENGQPYVMAITGTSSEAGWWELDYSTDLQTWSPYTYDYGTDVSVLFWLDPSEPQMFFRLVNYYY